MAFTEKEMAGQRQAFEALQDEFSRLNAQLDGMLKEGGLSEEDLRKALDENHSPEVRTFLDKAREEAVRAGQARAAQAPSSGDKVSSAPGRGRPGVVRL